MKTWRIIPVLISMVLILTAAGSAFGPAVYAKERYGPGTEHSGTGKTGPQETRKTLKSLKDRLFISMEHKDEEDSEEDDSPEVIDSHDNVEVIDSDENSEVSDSDDSPEASDSVDNTQDTEENLQITFEEADVFYNAGTRTAEYYRYDGEETILLKKEQFETAPEWASTSEMYSYTYFDPDGREVSVSSGVFRKAALITGKDGDGKILWEKLITARTEATELKQLYSIGQWKDRFYYGYCGSVAALDVRNGDELWEVEDCGCGNYAGSLIGEDGTVYISGYYGPDLSIISSKGELLFREERFNPEYFWPFVVLYDEQAEEVSVVFEGGEYDEFSVPYNQKWCHIVSCDTKTGESSLDLSRKLPESREEAEEFCREKGGELVEIKADSVSASSELTGGDYDAMNVLDGDPKTAWVEGVDGVGYWEYLEFRLEPGKSVAFIELENGYWKSEDIFTKNGRPRALRISVGSPYSTTNWALIYPETDYEGKTFYALPGELTVDDSGKLYLVILDAMAGTKYEDTCISGVKFWGIEGAREESGAENAAGNGTEDSSGNGADGAAGNDSGNSADSSAGDQSGSIAGSAESNSAETAGSAAQTLPRDHAEMIKYIRGNYYYTQEHLADYTTDNGRLIFYQSYGIDLGDAGFNNLAYSMTSYNKGETVVKLAENHRNDPDSKLTMAEAFFLNPDYDAEREYGNPIHALLFIYALGKDSKEYRYYFRDGYVIRYIDPEHVTHDYEEGILIDDYALDHDPDGIFEAACIVPLMLSEHYYYIKSGMIER